jgi:type VI protein secretion system component Hcp
MDLRRSGSEAVKGDAQTAGFEGQIELWDWSWGAQLGSATTGTAIDSRNLEANSVAICKSHDRATTALLSLLQSGETCEKAVLFLSQSMGRSQQVIITLKGVRFMAVKFKIESSDKEVYVDEDWTLEYDELTVHYRPPAVDLTGRPTGRMEAARTFHLKTTPGVKKGETRRIETPDAPGKMSDSDMEEQMTRLLKKMKVIK